VWLIKEATDRLFYDEEININAKVMFITAFVSLACNIFNLVALGHCPMPWFKSHSADGHDEENFMDSVMSIYKPHGGHNCSHHGHGHGHSHGHGGGCDGHKHDHDHGHDDHDHHGHEQKKVNLKVQRESTSSSSAVTSKHNSAKSSIVDVENEDNISRLSVQTTGASKLLSGIGGLKIEPIEQEEIDELHNHAHGRHSVSNHKEEENINIRAAVVHVIGDML